MRSLFRLGFITGTLLSTTTVYSLTLEKSDREARISTTQLSVVVRDGAFIEVKDLPSGKLWADRTINDTQFPTGLGVLTDLEKFRAGHIPWGEPSLSQHLPPDFSLVNYFKPTQESVYSVEEKEGIVTMRWEGLSNGIDFSKESTFELIISEESDGSLAYRVNGFHPKGGVFGAIAPVLNLSRKARIITPSFGGMEYGNEGPAALMPLGGAPFMEAPMLVATDGGAAISIWMQDASMRSFYAFVKRWQKGFGLGMELLNLMPYEPHQTIETKTFYLRTFDKGGWKAAATPFREWYQQAFKEEIAVRDSVEWANRVSVIIDVYMTIPGAHELAKIAEIFPKKNVLFQIWNARAPLFDHELPDWTPRAGYVEGVKRLHDEGFKAMAYVNTYCANYLSPVWKRDRLSEFVLTRKNGAWTYKAQSVSDPNSSLNEKLIGTVDYVSGGDQFANIPEGRLLYVDPLTPRWRTYHAEMMKVWNEETGTDANYEDTAGTVSDSGNGVVEGLSAGEGSVEIMRLLQKTQPQVPMASEYGPAGIAFATRWALNFASHWGNSQFKKYRISHQLPLTNYLYGYRQWVSALRTSDDTTFHSITATSDATGGMGFILVDAFNGRTREMLETMYNWPGHLYLRSVLFSEKELAPHFPEGDYPESVRCLYKGVDGIYQYTDDGVLQQMLSPGGEPLYGRLHGANRVKTSLWLANWPLQGDGEIVGLDPEGHYPLFPRPEGPTSCAIAIPKFPERVVLKNYYEGPGYVFMELADMPRGPKEVDLDVKSAVTFRSAFLNDTPADPTRITGELPLSVVLLDKAAAEGQTHPILRHEKKTLHGQDLFLQNGKNVRSHYVMEVPKEGGALEFAFANFQERYPYHGFDGSIVRLIINGREIRAFDCLAAGSKEPDMKLRRWSVPLAEYAGKTILVTVETDCKGNAVQDRQFISIPKIVATGPEKFEEVVIDGEEGK